MTGIFSKLFGQQRSVFGDSDDVEPKDVIRASNARQDSGLESLPVSAQLLYPGADQSVAMKTRGPYRRGYPEGAVVHYTAGRFEKGDADAVATMKYGASDFCYFCISATGKVYQGAPLDRWGSHAGGSKWPGLGSWVSQYLVGIEICSAGLLEQAPAGLKPWWGKPLVPETLARKVEVRENINQAGWYHAYTQAQEDALTELILWLHGNAPDTFQLDLVLGHDEVASPAGRKNDPGGALSTSMPALREKLRTLAAARFQPAAPMS